MTPRQVQILIGVGVFVAVLLTVLVVALVVGWEDPVAAPTSLPASTSSSEPTSTTSPLSTTTSTSSTTTSSTTSTSTSTSTSTTTTTTLPPGACLTSGAGPIPAGSTVEEEAAGDFDGDGAEDRFLIYEPGGMVDLVFRVELSYGWAEEVGFFLDVIDLKVLNLGGPVGLAVVVTRDHGGNHARFIVLERCGLDQAGLDNGDDAVFWLEDTSEWKAGVTCTAYGISVTQAENIGGGDWEASSFSYTWNPDALLFEETGMGVALILHSPEDDAAIQSAADWDC